MKIREDQIVGLIKQGTDQKVIEHLYKTVFPRVKRYIISKKGNQDDAADAFQEAIMSLYKHIIAHTYNEKYTPYGYLYTVSINRWLNAIRKTSKLQFTEEAIEDPEITTQEHTAFLNQKEEKKSLLDQFFVDLGEKCLELLKYSIYQNLLLEDIALRMGIAGTDAAKMQLFRCKQKMMKTLEDNPHLKSQLLNSL